MATTLCRDVMATVSPSFTAFNTDGNESLISRTDAVFIVKQGCFTNWECQVLGKAETTQLILC